ncbi:hypothetical protein Cgig2_023556 [Carnegiea gigantea]|uniref:Uncharacterized protein n=1 Tax=Carnegiea gigantea TaxID=171969 RepID=A0A9Q1Q977_9CARY|nr:hypothetical protein Cgig2_023556 [Carnegiea gigantea]
MKENPAFSEKNFSKVVLSSQRSKSTNNSIKRRLHTTVNLWREKENSENHKCFKGNVEMAFPSLCILVVFKNCRIDGMKDTMVCSSAWRMQMGRKMNALLTTSQMNREARLLCEEYFSKFKKLIKVEVESVHIELANLEVQRSTKVIPQNVDAVLVQNDVPLYMNVLYSGSSSQGNVVPTLNLLSNSNPNNQSLPQSTITAVGYYPPFYFDPRTARGENGCQDQKLAECSLLEFNIDNALTLQLLFVDMHQRIRDH